jgi:hypothetical protein
LRFFAQTGPFAGGLGKLSRDFARFQQDHDLRKAGATGRPLRTAFVSFRARLRETAIATSMIATKLNAAISAMMTQNPVVLFDMAGLPILDR